jgi:hypothetical protein
VSKIATVPELLDYLDVKNDRGTAPGYQAILDGMERFIENYTGRKFSPEPDLVVGADTATPVLKTFIVQRQQAVVRIPDLRMATSVSLGGVALEEWVGYQIDFYGEPAQSIHLAITPYGIGGISYFGTSALANQLQIVGRWGFNPPPPDVKDCVLALAARRIKEKKSSWSDSVAMPDGSVLSYFRQLPASVQGEINLYRSPKIALV